jgi:protein gp37
MGEQTGVSWTDATWNAWEGCTKVGPGCDACYAEARDMRWHEGAHWGPGAPRRRMVEATFQRPFKWNRKREAWDEKCRLLNVDPLGPFPPGTPVPPLWVFCSSLSDFFDNEVDPQWRADAWKVIRATTHLRWQLVTKRVTNVAKMLPPDWGDGSAYAHVGIIATVVTQAEANRDVPRLCTLQDQGVHWVGLSMEPLLEPVNLSRAWDPRDLDWVIIGGESRQGGAAARPLHLGWVRDLLAQCRDFKVPCWVKQLGDNPVGTAQDVMAWAQEWTLLEGGHARPVLGAHAGTDPAEWPEDLRVRQYPKVYDAVR